jgi:competence protein CoiA
VKFALNNGVRIEASPGLAGACPGCGWRVVAKCGADKVWHWAHERHAECDSWSEPESEWHRAWKNRFPKEWQEVTMKPHRADVKGPKCVVEFQSSPIDGETIRERENFYGNMVWVINGNKFEDRVYFDRDQDHHMQFMNRWEKLPKQDKFTWYRYHKAWLNATKPLFFDFTEGLFRVDNVREHYWGSRDRKVICGTGKFITYPDFQMDVVGTMWLPQLEKKPAPPPPQSTVNLWDSFIRRRW